MEEWLSISDAARRLTDAGDSVTRSSLSRYLDQHAEALATKIDGKKRLVEYGQLLNHRRENIRIIAQPAAKQAKQLTGTQADGAARKVQAEATIRELDLAERLKLITRTTEVDRAGRDAVALMRSSFERLLEPQAADLSLKYGWDERTVRLALKSFAHAGVDIFNSIMLEHLDALRGEKNGDSAPIEP